MEPVKVVLRYLNGKILKGYTQDFFPNKDRFHLFPVDQPKSQATEVVMNGLKAVFVVRDFGGNPTYDERRHFLEGERPAGRRVEVTFSDGEILVGSTLGYDLNRPGFFVFPADPHGNNVRVFVVCSAVTKARQL